VSDTTAIRKMITHEMDELIRTRAVLKKHMDEIEEELQSYDTALGVLQELTDAG